MLLGLIGLIVVLVLMNRNAQMKSILKPISAISIAAAFWKGVSRLNSGKYFAINQMARAAISP